MRCIQFVRQGLLRKEKFLLMLERQTVLLPKHEAVEGALNQLSGEEHHTQYVPAHSKAAYRRLKIHNCIECNDKQWAIVKQQKTWSNQEIDKTDR